MNLRTDSPEVQAIPERLAIDTDALARFLASAMPQLGNRFSLAKFKGGQSNPTYRLDVENASFVLRRKPPGQTLASAHAIDREARVMRALKGIGFPVPRIFAECADPGVIGSAFYVMEYLDGRIFWDAALPGQSCDDRRSIYLSLIDTLAALHAVEIEAAGLSDFGPSGNYYARQIGRWAAQYGAIKDDPLPEIEQLIAWLTAHIPADTRATLVHGDYRLDNAVFHKDRPEIIGVIDWELATIGNPIADLSYFLLSWIVPLDLTGSGALAGRDLPALGIPTAGEIVDRYFGCSKIDRPSDFIFHHAYNLFRLAAIMHGIASRDRRGNAASDRAGRFGPLATQVARAACELIETSRLSPKTAGCSP
jgi:aminoglycoside phosphotransferase (APT) family kinase protein